MRGECEGGLCRASVREGCVEGECEGGLCRAGVREGGVEGGCECEGGACVCVCVLAHLSFQPHFLQR